jgi:hypothetical protein
MIFRLVEKLSDGLLVISTDGDSTIWSQAKLRRERECAKCERALRVGDTVFSPMANRPYRYLRMCSPCAEGLMK